MNASAILCASAFSTAGALLGLALGAIPAVERPRLGARGEQRTRALAEAPLFAAVEPCVRQVAGWVQAGRLTLPEEILAARLGRAGVWLGLSPAELSALSLLAAIAGGLALAPLGLGWGATGFVLGASAPHLRLVEEARSRARIAGRSLPGVIDLLVLCTSAGLDFPSAVRAVVAASAPADVLVRELSAVLLEIELGHTRRAALEALAVRLPAEPVRTLVAALIQAEEAGNPVDEVLRIQATSLRSRRGVAAEEAASRAGVLMVVPLFLLLGCILVLLFAPFLLEGGLK